MAAPNNTILTTDLEKGISIDFANRLYNNINGLSEILGVTEMIPLSAGNAVKIYELKKTADGGQVAEGETIPYTKITRMLAKTYDLTLKKYRKNTTAEAVQKVGRDVAVNMTDEKLVFAIQKDIKKSFYDLLGTGTGTAEEAETLQAALANVWGALSKHFDDMDVEPIYFVSTDDVASYLGTAQVTTQERFGFRYVEDFLGLGTVVFVPTLTKGTVIGTAKQNLNGAYVPANGDLSQTFGLTYDQSGLVGITHSVVTENASIDTLMMSGVMFYPEDLAGVVKGTIQAAPRV